MVLPGCPVGVPEVVVVVVVVMQVLVDVGCRAVVECLHHPGSAIVVHVDPESLVRQSLHRFQWCDAGCRSRRLCLSYSLLASGCECRRVLV